MEQCVSVTSVRVLEGYRLELTFSDNVRGTVDLTDRIVGRRGVFKALEDQQLFRQVRNSSGAGHYRVAERGGYLPGATP